MVLILYIILVGVFALGFYLGTIIKQIENMGNMRFKVGDRVRIKSIDWYNENKDKNGDIDISHDFTFYADRSKYCGRVFTISEVFDNCYFVKEDNNEYYWADEMFEGLVEPIDCKKCGLTRNSTRCLFMDNCPHNKEKNIIEIPKDYVIKDENDNVINATKIVLEKKKKEYPKTYEECCKILGLNDLINMHLGFMDEDTKIIASTNYHIKTLILLNCLTKLRICRDAYWKIAGEEMGLDKPWEPDYTNTGEKKFSIWVDFGEIKLGGPFTTTQMVLSFPTAKMRDAFYENFKELINSCKELL